jgi:Spx/MgsR family transcriptional regulator
MIHRMSSPLITLYGIPNCDTVRKARAWLAEAGVTVQFHDFKKQGVPEARLDAWLASAGWETLLNRKGTTWRKLDPGVQSAVLDAASAKALMLAQSSVIKRPVVEWHGPTGQAITVGFDAQRFAQALSGAVS